MVYRQPSPPASGAREEPSFAPFECRVDPIGVVSVRERVRVGSLCVVYRGEHEGAAVALKTARRAPIGHRALCASSFTGFETSLWGGETALHDGAVSPALVDRLLAVEAERIRHTNSRWNHAVYALGVWDPHIESHRWAGGAIDLSARSQLVLATPWFDGTPLDAVSIAEQRALLPSMLPALWDALCASAHGDLSPGNVLIDADRARFALIDPCVAIGSHRASQDQSALGWVDSTTMFTTNAAHYPIVPPLVGDPRASQLAPAAQRSPSGLLACLDAYAQRATFRDPAVSPSRAGRLARPDAADVLAVGLWYARVLGGEGAIDRLGIPRVPAWCGTCGERGQSAARSLAVARATVERFDSLAAADLGGAVTDAEAALARALLTGAIDGRASLVRLATDALLATSTPR